MTDKKETLDKLARMQKMWEEMRETVEAWEDDEYTLDSFIEEYQSCTDGDYIMAENSIVVRSEYDLKDRKVFVCNLVYKYISKGVFERMCTISDFIVVEFRR